MVSKGKQKHSDLIFRLYGEDLNARMVIPIFAHEMLGVITVKSRKSYCTKIFHQLQHVFHTVHKLLALSYKIYLRTKPILIQMMLPMILFCVI